MITILFFCALWSSIGICPSDGTAVSCAYCTGKGMTGKCDKRGICECPEKHYLSDGECILCDCERDGMTGECFGKGICYCEKTYFNNGNNCTGCNCTGKGMNGKCSYTGRCKCNPGFFERDNECIECEPCNGTGLSGACSWFNGRCLCDDGYHVIRDIFTGKFQCQRCNCKNGMICSKSGCKCPKGTQQKGNKKDGYYCEACECNGGRMSGDCYGNFCYCQSGYSMDDTVLIVGKNTCKRCYCKGNGMNGGCGQWNGECRCSRGYHGLGKRCTSCDCKGDGMNGNCHPNGKCVCNYGYDEFGSGCPKCQCKGDGMTGHCYNNICQCRHGYNRVGDECIQKN